MELRFDGRVVLVTGASSGIGRAIAHAFAMSGAKVAVNCYRNLEAAEKLVNTIRDSGGQAMLYQADVTDREAVEGIVAKIDKELGPIDVLVNNVGAAIRLCPFLEISDELWKNVLNVNLYSAFLCSRAVVRQMIDRRRGVIINISSVVARQGGAVGEVAYATAKGGLSAFTRGLAKELAQYGIRVNTVAPGATDTPFHAGLRSREELESFVERIPLGRLAMPEDIVGAVLFLASEASSYITGESIEVNGGFWFA
ncbi:SDR family NAD(P)-dependent oxidoreductase [Moorella sp. ACPs]|uniref:SDR family NAD(P)-dependent oxidoreductase n=1 Tax=Neomoorella carbonis TaxID=3062783 RepID=UPI003249EB37